MPYIDKDARARIDEGGAPTTVGELTYALTKQILRWIKPGSTFDAKFIDYAEAVAALECTKLELYRRSVAPYEDAKASENGDLYQ